MSLYTYEATVTRIIDGDTLVLSIDLGFTVWLHGQHLRLAHINAPEIATPEGLTAKAYLLSLLGGLLPTDVTLHTLKDRQDNYGRYLGVFVTPAGVNVNDALVAAGHAVPYEGKGKS